MLLRHNDLVTSPLKTKKKLKLLFQEDSDIFFLF